MARTEDREFNFILNMSRAMAEYTCDEHRDTAVNKAKLNAYICLLYTSDAADE